MPTGQDYSPVPSFVLICAGAVPPFFPAGRLPAPFVPPFLPVPVPDVCPRAPPSFVAIDFACRNSSR